MPRIAIVAALTALIALALAGPATASRGQLTFFEAGRLLLDDGTRDETLDEIDELGADAVRIVLYWRDVAPEPDARSKPSFDADDPDDYPRLAVFERAIAGARERGLRVMLTVSGPVPRWATARKRDHVTSPSPREYRRFVKAVARRLGRQVSWWSLWNEPNQSSFLKPQKRRGRPYAPRLWRKLFLAGRAGLRDAGFRRPRLLLGDTGPRGATSPITFLREALCLDRRWKRRRGCGRITATGWAHHPYSARRGPWVVPRNRNQVTMGTLSRLTRALDRAGRARAINRRMPIYLNEFGIQTYPDRLTGVPWWRQPQLLGWAELKAYRTSRVRSFSQYLMRDDEPRRDLPEIKRYSGFESGLRTWEGEKKPSYDGFRTPLVAYRSGRRWVTLWGHVRPARGRTVARLAYRDRGSRRWRALKRKRTDRRGYFTTRTRYRSGRRWRIEWRAPDGTRFAGPPIGVTRKP